MESLGLIQTASRTRRRLGQAMARLAPAGVTLAEFDPPATSSCPSCATTYGIPAGLVPPWGGRVRCPRCTEVFSVGVLAEAEEGLRAARDMDPGGFEGAVEGRSLWNDWGAVLLECYQALRERHGPELASRAFRRALEAAAPGVPWMAPPTPPNPLAPEPGASATLFERRLEGGA